MKDEVEKSRTQKKREFRELKALGQQLAKLSEGELARVPLSEMTRDAILEAQRLKRTAQQRQFRRLQSLLDREDVEAIRGALSRALEPHAEAVEQLHAAEDWRDRLLAKDAEIAAFAESFPACDRTHLRTLVRKARKERELEKPPAAARQLFRYLREIVEKEPTD
ncbi:MAG: ribosome biogenesis factor YjgA [Acidobacteriota bacterium]